MSVEDDLTVRARERVGRVLRGKYRLDQLLGVGGMAAVYQATHVRNAGKVAVKVLHREVSLDRDLHARFLREGYAANSVGHEGTVRVLDDDTADDGSAFLVMELLVGETVEARWERSGRRLNVGQVITIALDTLDVLAAAHAAGIVHRDCKPENLFITREGRLKVLDFGIARVRQTSPTKTRSGAVFGTPAFMAPEQALGRTREIDALTDVWAVGATMFTLLTGRYVHEGETAEEMVVRAATTPPPSLASSRWAVPAPVAAVIDRALSSNRQSRWQSAAAMRDALAQARDEVVLLIAEDFDTEAKTRIGPPPQMTVPPSTGEPQATAPMPTLPVTSSVGGVSSNSERHQAVRLMVAVCDGLRRVGATVAALAMTNALRHRRRIALAVGSGLATSVAIGTIVLIVAGTGRSKQVAVPSASGAPEPSAGGEASPMAEASSVAQAVASAAPLLPKSSAEPAPTPVTTTSAPRTRPAAPVAKPLRPKRDPLAP